MQKVERVLVLASVLALSGGTIHLSAQQQQPAQPQQKPQEQLEQQQQGQKDSVMSGHLVRVDAKAKTFTIRTDQHMQGHMQGAGTAQASQTDRTGQSTQTDRSGQTTQPDRSGQTTQPGRPGEGMQVEFAYNDATKVTGAGKNIEGLATMTEADVTVHYTTQAGKNMATWIEVKHDDSPGAGSPRNESSRPESPRPDSPKPDSSKPDSSQR